MRAFFLMSLLLISGGLFAQREGSKKEIDRQVFEYQKGFWLHEALGSNFDPVEEYTAVYKDRKWQNWYGQGSPTLKKILDLGANVVFRFKDKNNVPRVYWVLRDDDLLKKVLAGGAAAVLPGLAGVAGSAAGASAGAGGGGISTGVIIGVSAAAAAGVVVVVNANDEESSQMKK